MHLLLCGALFSFLHGDGKPVAHLSELTQPGVTGLFHGEVEDGPAGLTQAECLCAGHHAASMVDM